MADAITNRGAVHDPHQELRELYEVYFAHCGWDWIPRQQEERPVQYTLRLSYNESDDLEDLARALRTRRGRSTANSDVLRRLVALAKDNPDLQQCLAVELESS